MLQLLALVVLGCVAADLSRKIYLQRAVFAEHQQPMLLAWFVWLFPFPFLMPLFVKSLNLIFFFPFPMAVIFFLPAMVAAFVNRQCFEKSGDDRAKEAATVVHNASTAAIMGVMGILMFAFIRWALRR